MNSNKSHGFRNFVLILKEYYKIVTSILFRFLVFIHRKGQKKSKENIIIGFSSAWFGGNVKGLIDELSNNKKLIIDKKIKIYFTSPNKEQIQTAKKAGLDSYYWHDFKAIDIFSKTDIFVTSHGESYLPVTRRGKISDFISDVFGEFALKFNSIKKSYIDGNFKIKRLELWHGIPFKDVYIDKIPIPPDVFCVTSDFVKKSYSRKGYNPNIFKITGYPRNDILFKKINRSNILTELNIPIIKKIILYAPTWGHYTGMELFPWDNFKKSILELDKFAQEKQDIHFIIRTHKYWEGSEESNIDDLLGKCKNISWVSMSIYPDTYSLLSVTEVLITDWSSIAFDFMLKKKPIIFIDRPNPYGKFCFTPDERAGAIVKNQKELINALNDSVKNPNNFIKKYATNFDKVLDKAFYYKDGKAAKRCIKELVKLIEN